MSVLAEIVAHKREEIRAQRDRRPLAELRAACRDRPPVRDFAAALRPTAAARVRLIAEVKRASPSRGVLNAALDPVAQARAYATGGAAALSVLTDQKYFHGDLADLVAVRAVVDRPVLRKEFIVDEYQLWESRAAGADAVLLIVAAVSGDALRALFTVAGEAGLGTLVEAHTAAELDAALALGAGVVGVNNRDLTTLQVSLAASLELLPRVPRDRVAVAESGIHTAADVEKVVSAGAQAVLVGEALVRAADVGAKVRELTLA